MDPAPAPRERFVLPRTVTGLCASSWLLLAAWLGVWPAVASHRAASRELVAMRTAAITVAAHGCCCAARDEAATAGGEARRGCCDEPLGAPVRAPSCPDSGTARCSHCVGCGAAPLLAFATPAPDPQRSVLGSLPDSDLVTDSRHLRPPVPPPRGAGEFHFA